MKKCLAIFITALFVMSVLPAYAFGVNAAKKAEKSLTKVETVSDLSHIRLSVGQEAGGIYKDELGKASCEKNEFRVKAGNGSVLRMKLTDASAYVGIEDTYVGVCEGYSVVSEFFDGAIRHSFVIQDESSPERYEIDYSLAEGAHLRLARDPDGETDGSIEVVDNEGNVVAAIFPAWAKDAAGRAVPTHYEIEGSTLVQVVEHKSYDNCDYPVVADPAVAYSNWFTGSPSWYKTTAVSASWVGKKSVYVLELCPNHELELLATASALGGVIPIAARNASWTAAYDRCHTSKHWYNTDGMRNQYYCHFSLLMVKRIVAGSWLIHLEPKRKDVGLARTIEKKCNP